MLSVFILCVLIVCQIFKHTVRAVPCPARVGTLCVYFVIYLFRALFICKCDVYSDCFESWLTTCSAEGHASLVQYVQSSCSHLYIYVAWLGIRCLRCYVTMVTEHGREWALLCCCCCRFPIGCAGERLLVLWLWHSLCDVSVMTSHHIAVQPKCTVRHNPVTPYNIYSHVTVHRNRFLFK
jgi:hypothetical protein